MANSPKSSFGMSFEVSSLTDQLEALGKDAGEFTRQAAQAGAQVLYEAARLGAPVSDHGHTFYGTHGRYYFPAGTLRDSIYQVYSNDNSSSGHWATYHISWNHQKAPYGFMVEYGTSNAPAHPFIRPAYDLAKKPSETVAKDKFENLMQDAIDKAKA